MRTNNKGFLLIVILTILTFAFTFTARTEGINTEILSDFDICQADLRDVFRSLAEIGNMNVLLDPSVKGEATIKLKNGMTVQEAMKMLAQTYGYSYRWVETTRTMLIGNEKTFSNFEAKETRIYQFSYANIEQVADALKVIIPKEQIGIDKRTNQLTIRASVLEHQNIAELATRLDREMPQINIEARIEEVSQTATKELGINWSAPEAQKVELFRGNIDFHTISTITIKALEEENKAKLLANPNISTTDSQEGKIFIGDKYPVITSDKTEEGITYKIEYIEIGTILTVIPRINEDNIVTVIVKAVVSSILDWKKAGDNDIPVIRTREASSVIRLKEGETFVLSGLNMQKDNLTKQSTPGLAKIPLLGSLFTTKKNGPIEDSEVIIFLTPKIVRTKPAEKMPVKTTVAETTKPVDKPAIVETKSQPESTPATQLNAGTNEIKSNEIQKETAVTPTASPVLPVTPVVPTPSNPPAKPAVTTPPAVTVPAADTAVQNQEQAQKEQLQQLEANREEAPVAGYVAQYTIKQGDTLSTVSEKFGVAADNISQVNKITPDSGVSQGQEIKIPVPENQLYTLKPKETLWRLAKRYGTTVELLMEINCIDNYSKLGVGQTIILPVPVDQVADNRF